MKAVNDFFSRSLDSHPKGLEKFPLDLWVLNAKCNLHALMALWLGEEEVRV